MVVVLFVVALSLAFAPSALAAEGGQITGTLTSAATKAGIEGVEVCAERLIGGWPPCAQTNASGEYTLVVVWGGNYRVAFKAPTGSSYIRRTYYGGKYSYSEAAMVSVPEGGTASGIDAELEEGGRISGTVSGASPKVGLEGLEVCAREPEHPRNLSDPEKNSGCATTNSSGEYSIAGLATGAYEVEFEVPYSSQLNFFTQFYDEKSSWPEASLVSVTAGTSISGIDAELPDGGQISGRVTSASTGAAIEKAEVCARGKSEEGYEGKCATTNANGEYTINRLKTAKFAVEFTASGYVSEHLGGEWGLTEVEHAVSVTTGSMTSGVHMALKELPRIAGTVTKASTKTPIAGIEVCVRLVSSTANSACKITDAQGEYAISGLVVGEYTVEFSPGSLNYLTQYYDGAIFSYDATRISAMPGTDATGIGAELEEPGTISGKVTSASTKAPLEGIHVCAGEPPEGNRTCDTTNAQGEYTIPGLPGRDYYVEFSAGDVNYLTQFYANKYSRAEAQPVSVLAGATTSGIDAELAPIKGAGLTGTVWSSETEKPIAGIEVCAYEASGEGLFGECAKTESRGEYTITGLTAGEYVVEFSSPSNSGLNYVTQYYNEKSSVSEAGVVFVGTGSLTPGVDARLREGGRIAGQALDASSRHAIKGIEVCAFATQSESVGCAITGAGGEYTIAGLAHGQYAVEFSSPIEGGLDYVTQFFDGKTSPSEANTVSVEEGGTQSGIDVALQQGGRIAGRVTDASSKAAIQGVLVCALTMAGKAEACTVTNPSGEYETATIPSGEYKVGFDGGKKYVIDYYGGKFSLSEAQVVPVPIGSTVSGIEAAMPPSDLIPPANTKPPVVLGSPAVNEMLLCANGLWTGSPVPSLIERWLRDGAPIPGASGSTYKVQSADEGHGLACEVTASSAAGEKRALSAAVAIPASLSTAPTPTVPLTSTATTGAPATPSPESGTSSVTILASTIVVVGGTARVGVQCRVKTCSGSVELTARVLTKLRRGKKTVSRREAIVVAKGSLSLVGKGKSAGVVLRLTAAGKRWIAGATKHHPSAAELVVSMAGGKMISKAVLVA
jgi:hypothetical protein